MEELIFFAVIIFFSILESIARSRKAKKGGGEVEAEERSGPDFPDMESSLPDLGRRSSESRKRKGERLPAYDDDPSYDDLATQERDRALERYTRPHGTDEALPGERRPSSETMLPGDLLEQLEGLARGREPELERRQAGKPTEEGRRREELRRQRRENERRKREARERLERAEQQRAEAERASLEARRSGGRGLPAPSKPLPSLERTEVGSGDVWSGGVGSRAPIGSGEHAIHRSHSEYGTDPSSRSPSAQGRIDPFAEPLDAQGVAVRRQLLQGGRKALRDAVVFKEVLGKPVALRDEHLREG